jgi:hypothetical protein
MHFANFGLAQKGEFNQQNAFEIEAAQAVTEFTGAVQLVVAPCQTFAEAETKLEIK